MFRPQLEAAGRGARVGGSALPETASSWSARLDDKDKNSFDAIRLGLASLVVFEHSFFLIFNSFEAEPLSRLTGGQFNAGNFAVCMFFAISGFLVTRSYVLTADLWRYLAKRVARIAPGFLVASVIGYVILAPLTADDIGRYFAGQNWLAVTLRTLALHQVSVTGILNGNAVDLIHGTLWTIKYEFDCYLAVALLGSLGLLTPRRALLPYLVIVGALALAQAGLFRLPRVDNGPLSLLISDPVQWPFLFLFFFVGSAFYIYRREVPKSAVLCGLAAALMVVSAVTGGLYWAVLLGGTYLVMYLALSSAVELRLFGRRVDLSYGVYLYGWPVAQVLLYVAHQKLTPWALFPLTLVITYIVAFLSWRLVEYPSLRAIKGRKA
jgi:peptidoglycan/LPS O-acetylase OafA/YrhL